MAQQYDDVVATVPERVRERLDGATRPGIAPTAAVLGVATAAPPTTAVLDGGAR